MERKTMAAFAAALLVLAGVAFAMPGWGMMQGNWRGTGMADSTVWQNRTANWHAFGYNATFNQTQADQFKQAVQSGDYQTALQLHQQYGIGGRLFDRLNSTTFATYSQIYGLQSQLHTLNGQLRQELGISQNTSAGAHPNSTAARPGFGFGRGMRHR